MNSKSLQEIREKLNNMIENSSDPKEILKISVELDNLIADYMENNMDKLRND